MCSQPFTLSGWSLHRERRFTNVQWTLHPSWERRITQCAVGPSSLLRDEVYPVCSEPLIHPRDEVWSVCSGPLIPPERGGLPSVQWGLSSLLREKVYPVCSGPLISPEIGGLPGVQWALHPSWETRFIQCAVGPSSLPGSARWGLPIVQRAPHPS